MESKRMQAPASSDRARDDFVAALLAIEGYTKLSDDDRRTLESARKTYIEAIREELEESKDDKAGIR
jgi:hypothetical protein